MKTKFKIEYIDKKEDANFTPPETLESYIKALDKAQADKNNPKIIAKPTKIIEVNEDGQTVNHYSIQ